MANHLTTFYGLLREKVGFSRRRDVRLEKIAADRALELRYQVGTTGSMLPEHPRHQLMARVFPHLAAGYGWGVTENASWHYYPPSWVDPIAAAVDATLPDGTKVGFWNSADHRSQLLDPRYTEWGCGIYYEDPTVNGSRRWYFITVFAEDMEPLVLRSATLQPGVHRGYQFSAAGQVLGNPGRTISAPTVVQVDDRHTWPKYGPMLHVHTGVLKRHWLTESAVTHLDPVA